MAALFVAAMREWKRSTEREGREQGLRPMPGVQLRVEKVMDVTISREVERLERRLTFLATVGSTAPFIGLFGTVWGIMTSFQAIAVSKNTSLAVVAPGIAEALFATALGLLAAIPAVIFYNKFNSEVARHAARLEGFADEFAAILSRQIDETELSRPWAQDYSLEAALSKPASTAPLGAADERDQRHADGRRHARAADHLHGDGAAAHRRRRRRIEGRVAQSRAAENRSRAGRVREGAVDRLVDPQGQDLPAEHGNSALTNLCPN